MNSKGKVVALAIVGFCFAGCSGSSEPDTINRLYRESDSYRARLLAVGCQVGNQQSMARKIEVYCTDTESDETLLQRARIFKEWSKVLAQIENHPDLPGVAQSSYQRLQKLITEYADEVENFVVTERQSAKDQLERTTKLFVSWSTALLEQEENILELGCDFLEDPLPENFEETCNLYFAAEKAQILKEFEALAPQGQDLMRQAENMPFAEELKELNVKLMDLTIALRAHLTDNAAAARLNANVMVVKLRSDFGVHFRAGGVTEVPMEILLPEEMRTDEGVGLMVAALEEYIEAVTLLAEHIDFLDAPSTVTVHEKRKQAAISFLKEPVTLEYIIEFYEPEQKPEQNLPMDTTPAPVPSRSGGIFASGPHFNPVL